jgi:hypothetical protein
MRKIYKIYITVAFFLLALIITVVFFHFKNNNDGNNTFVPGFELSTVSVIPTDAIAVLHFNGISNSIDLLSDTSYMFPPLYPSLSPVGNLINLSVSGGISQLTVSFHYSAKNEMSPLVILYFDSDSSFASNSGNILRKMSAVKESSYNGVDIFAGGGMKFFKQGRMIVASNSLIILQSSIRHVISGASIMDNSNFKEIVATTLHGDHMCFFNIQQVGKIFSSFTKYPYWKYADFFSKISSWCSFKYDIIGNDVYISGDMYNTGGRRDFATIFQYAEAGSSQLSNILPYNTLGALSISVKDFNKLLSSFYEYKRSYKVIDQSLFENEKQWFMSQNPEELVLALLPYKSSYRWVTLIRSKQAEKERSVTLFEHKGALERLFGKAFSYNNENFVLKSGHWQFIGDEDILQGFASGNFERYSLKDFIAQGEAYSAMTKSYAPLTVIANVSVMPDSVGNIFREPFSSRVSAKLHEKNYQIIIFKLFPYDNKTGFSLNLNSQRVVKLREPDTDLVNIPDTVRIPSGPFTLSKDENEKLILEQLPDYKLRLKHTDGKGIWTIPFEGALRGFVEEVDYFSHKSYQMLFASGNKLYLLDKRGRFVGRFPKSVDSVIVLGPKVYERPDGEGFNIMLLHPGNTLRMYDKECHPVEGWKDIILDETIEDFPEMLIVDGKTFWVLRTRTKTVIYRENGEAVGDLKGDRTLLPDSKIRVLNGTKVAVSTRKGKEAVLDLESGKLSKLKKSDL